MTNTTYPIRVTETPHQGEPRTWVLENAEHLASCIEDAQRRGYDDWQVEQGNMVWADSAEDEDGNFILTKNEGYTVDAYLDFLRDDLSRLYVVRPGEEIFDISMIRVGDQGDKEPMAYCFTREQVKYYIRSLYTPDMDIPDDVFERFDDFYDFSDCVAWCIGDYIYTAQIA